MDSVRLKLYIRVFCVPRNTQLYKIYHEKSAPSSKATTLHPGIYLPYQSLNDFCPKETPSLCNKPPPLISLIHRPTPQPLNHTQHLPRTLARLNQHINLLRQRLDQLIHLLTPAQLIRVQIQDLERDICSQLRDAVVGYAFYAPVEDGRDGEFVAVLEGGAQGGAVDEGGEEGAGLVVFAVVLERVSMVAKQEQVYVRMNRIPSLLHWHTVRSEELSPMACLSLSCCACCRQ